MRPRRRRSSEDLEDQVRRRTMELEAALKELEAFSYSVSHDLRAPLRAVDGFARLFEEKYGSCVDDEGRRLLGIIRDSSRRMGVLLDSLLSYSRLGRQALHPAQVDMRALAAGAWAELAAEARATCAVAQLPEARGDPVLLRQVWANLLSNALKYSSKRAEPRIEVSGRREGGALVYSVMDNGAGFDMRHADRLFGVFQRLHPESEFPGTGAGLATVQRIVARHGGRVWAEAAPDAGATFWFSLPAETQT